MKWVSLAALVGTVAAAALLPQAKPKAADVPPKYIPGWVRPADVEVPPLEGCEQ